LIQNSPLSNEGKEQSNTHWYHKNRWFMCEHCTFVFQTHSQFSKNNRSVHCPNCGKSDGVMKYESQRYNHQKTRIDWKEDEIAELVKEFNDGLMPHQIAINLGRSIGSVREKLRRMGLWKRRVIG
jgi:DNA replicative helicase MCM subunit Mcm2 (Cdc46/Mcm family)